MAPAIVKTGSVIVTYLSLALYVSLSTGVIMYNKWILAKAYFGFSFPITLTMIHMAFSGFVATLLVHVFKVVQPVKMTTSVYFTCVVPISAFFAASLWFGNAAYLYLSVAFIQMLKSLMPVATFILGVLCLTDKPRFDIFANMIWISGGVCLASYGEVHLNLLGTAFQLTGICCEALRLVLTQVLLQKKGLSLNPITSLYYIAPCSLLFLSIPWFIIERPAMLMTPVPFNFLVFFTNALCALALNLSTFLVIGRTGAVTVRVASIVKDWLLIGLSTLIFPDAYLSLITVGGYSLALGGVVMYNYIKIKEARQGPILPEKKVEN